MNNELQLVTSVVLLKQR